MILRITLLQRLDGMTPAAFERYWLDVHAPLAARLQGLSLYHLNAVRATAGSHAMESLPLWPVDGIAQLGFADFEAMKSAGSTAAGKADRVNFIKLQQTLVCRRGSGEDGPAQEGRLAKCMVFLRRPRGITAAQFEEAWLRGPSVSPASQRGGMVARVRNLVVDRWPEPWVSASYEAMPVDGVEELWFDSDAAMAAFTADLRNPSRPDRRDHVEGELVLGLEAHRVIG